MGETKKSACVSERVCVSAQVFEKVCACVKKMCEQVCKRNARRACVLRIRENNMNRTTAQQILLSVTYENLASTSFQTGSHEGGNTLAAV